MKSARILIVLLALSVPSAALAKVTVDWDKSKDFSKYNTFAWKEGTPLKNTLMQNRIEAAIEGALVEDGLMQVEGSPDLYVIVHTQVKGEKSIDVNNFGYGGYGYRGWGGWGGGGSTTVNIRELTAGTIIVDLVDSRTNDLLWRAVATETMEQNPKPEKVEKKINKAVKKMFKKFPPPQDK